MTAPDVAVVIAEKLRRRAAFIQRWNSTSSPERHKTLEDEAVEAAPELVEAADLLESQAKALPCCDGCGSTRSMEWIRAEGYRSCCPERKMLTAKEWSDRALAAESRLAEAMRVIEPFARAIADDGTFIGLARSRDYLAARDFLNAAKEKTDAQSE